MVAVFAPLAGLLLGFLDFVWIKFVPAPFGGLGNSIAVWAVAAFLLTYYRRWAMGPAIAGAVIMLVVAVPTYYVAATLIQNDDWSNIGAPSSVLWMGLGVVAGVVFGAGGVLARSPGRLRRPALGLPAAVLLAEIVLRPDGLAYTLVLIGLAVLITVLAGRTGRDRILALAWSVPLGALGYLLMITTAFRGL
ncbi:DUF6518 family protein [Actinoplanes sp. NPDC049265]|uniref:DUF6518 family protein n=1 Tax=Actinoplanes sp. NPDC049265 TaxID=3363902 RepID=UPI003723CDD7